MGALSERTPLAARLIEELAPVLAGAPAEHGPALRRRMRELVDRTFVKLSLQDGGLRAALRHTLLHTALPVPERVRLGVLAAAVRSGELSLAANGAFVTAPAFLAEATAFGVPPVPAAMAYALLLNRWRHLHRPPPAASRVGAYLGLLECGLTARADIVRTSTAALAQAFDASPRLARQVRQRALRDLDVRGPGEVVQTAGKGERHVCCPPFPEPRWEDRYDFFGEGSRLADLVRALRENVQGRIRRMFASLVTADVRQAAADFGVGDAALYDTAAAGPPFFGSGEAIQTVDDLGTRTTRAQAEAWIANVRRQLEQVHDRLRVVALDSWIWTGDDPGIWNAGGGDGSQVHLNIMSGSTELMNAAPPPSGGGWPIDSSNYNDGAIAFGFWGSAYAYQTAIPVGGGTIPALDVTGFELQYVGFDDWLFDKAEIYFRYAVNGHSRLLTDGQPADDQYVRQDDRVHRDTDAGWVTYGYYGLWGVRSDSRLARARAAYRRLQDTLTAVQRALAAPDLDNIFVTRGDEIVGALREAAVRTRQGEHALARGHYAAVLEILAGIAPDDLTDLARELLFALHVLLAESYAASGSLPYAYAHLVEAHAHLAPGDAQSAAYLWLRLGDLFLRWGDQIYAAAGGDYQARLLALDRYRKLTEPVMALTYDDGGEDEILDLWIDLGRGDGTVPANARAWMQGLTVRGVSFFPAVEAGAAVAGALGVLPAFGRAAPIAAWEVFPAANASSERFLRVHLDVTETRLSRAALDLVIANARAALDAWTPTEVRVQARVATYDALARRSPARFRGRDADILGWRVRLGAPAVAGAQGSWTVMLAAKAAGGANALPAPAGCAADMLRARARLRIDQIRAHLNVYGLHDEYVPNGRFQSLLRLAAGLAERAAYFHARHVEFLAKAEAATLEELDAAFMKQLGDANLDLARRRLAAAGVDLEAAGAAATAAGEVTALSQRTLDAFQGTYQIGLLRFLNSVSMGLPPNVGINLGGFAGSLSGADGYDAQMRTRELEYESAVARNQAALEAAEFRRRLAELEQLIAQDTLAIEEARNAQFQERVDFLRHRTLNATYWYETARLYREMAEAKIQAAARWAWMAERALEFELNVPVARIRMDYHLLPLGAERLRSDLDELQVTLAEFRERYRDVPNIIEREFHLSRDFHEQFRALTS
ncbi:MAG TPA: hypothetical protein VFX28_17515, partial [Methylomirabilota bacterium]|nr:hypothetical protein [Methylomirabilota bacterium]